MKNKIYIALDIGGTKFMAAAIDCNKQIIAREKAAAPSTLREGLDLLKSMIGRVCGNAEIVAIGASAGGPLDYLTGVISPLHSPEWRNVPLKSIMEKEYKVPFTVDVDTNAAALAEYQFCDKKADRLLYLTLSTGLGGGFIVDGQIYRGSNGSHPEVGHQGIIYRLPISGPVACPCGATDCLEAIVCGSAIKKIYKKSAEELLDEEWSQVAYNLGQGIRNLAAIYAPSLVVLGGGMALGGGDRLIGGIRKVLDENVKIVPVPHVKLSELGYDTALWGAYALALKA
jgi:glucokinase